MKSEEYKFREFGGITLISLVVVIVLLLILSAITLNISMRDNGIFKKAEIGKIENKRSQIREYLDIRLLEEQTINYEETAKETIENTRKTVIKNEQDLKRLGKEIEIKEVEEENKEIYFYVIVDKDVYKVSLKGTKYIGKQSDKKIELQEGDIKFTYKPSIETNENVKVGIEVKKQIEGYKLEYKTEKTGKSGEVNNWTNYTGEITLTRNQSVYARLYSIIGESKVATGTVVNIDKLEPNEFTPQIEATTNSIKITALATDQEKTSDNASSGIAGYRFYISSENKWTPYQVNGEYTYNNLTQNTDYTIKVEAKDKAENTKEIELTTKTNTVTGIKTGDVTFSYNPTTLTNGNVKVGISGNKTGYTLQYKTEKTGESGEVNNWTNYTGEITLTRNQDIYARVVDSTGQSSTTYATGTIANIDKLSPNIFNLTTNVVTSNSIIITASAADESKTSDNANSGISGYRFSIDGLVTWSAYQTSASYTFNNLTQNTLYEITVEVKDNAGNTTKAQKKVTTPKQLATGVSLNKTSTTINIGETEQLRATVTPSTTYDQSITWTSSNTNIATVALDGTVTAVAPGTAIITATTRDGSNKSASCTVTVENKLYIIKDGIIKINGAYTNVSASRRDTDDTDGYFTIYTDNTASRSGWYTTTTFDFSKYKTINCDYEITASTLGNVTGAASALTTIKSNQTIANCTGISGSGLGTKKASRTTKVFDYLSKVSFSSGRIAIWKNQTSSACYIKFNIYNLWFEG